MQRIAWVGIAIVSLVSLLGFPCTFFSLCQDELVLFANNEDWSDLGTRLWVVPASDTEYGCVFLGFSGLFA